MYGSVEIGVDFIQIFDENDYELFYWDIQEWIDEPELALTIADAIKDVYTNSMDELKKYDPWKAAYLNALEGEEDNG